MNKATRVPVSTLFLSHTYTQADMKTEMVTNNKKNH